MLLYRMVEANICTLLSPSPHPISVLYSVSENDSLWFTLIPSQAVFFPEKYNISFRILHECRGCDFFFLLCFSQRSSAAAPVMNRHLRSTREKLMLYLGPTLRTSRRITHQLLAKGNVLWEMLTWTFKFLGYEMQNNRIREARGGRCLRSSPHFPANEGCGFTRSASGKKNTLVTAQTKLDRVKQERCWCFVQFFICVWMKTSKQTTKALVWIFTPVDDCLKHVFSVHAVYAYI